MPETGIRVLCTVGLNPQNNLMSQVILPLFYRWSEESYWVVCLSLAQGKLWVYLYIFTSTCKSRITMLCDVSLPLRFECLESRNPFFSPLQYLNMLWEVTQIFSARIALNSIYSSQQPYKVLFYPIYPIGGDDWHPTQDRWDWQQFTSYIYS